MLNSKRIIGISAFICLSLALFFYVIYFDGFFKLDTSVTDTLIRYILLYRLPDFIAPVILLGLTVNFLFKFSKFQLRVKIIFVILAVLCVIGTIISLSNSYEVLFQFEWSSLGLYHMEKWLKFRRPALISTTILFLLSIIFIIMRLFIKNVDIIKPPVKFTLKIKNLKDGRHLLDLSNKRISDISMIDGLNQYTGLTELILDNNYITEIEGIQHLKSLKKLSLENNKIEEIKNLNFLEELEILNLSRNKIKEIKNLESLINLKNLNLSNNSIEEIQNLNLLLNLERLNLSHNQIKEIRGLNVINSIKELILSNNNIEQLKGLENLENLSYLSIRNNPVYNWILREIGNRKTAKFAVLHCKKIKRMFKFDPTENEKLNHLKEELEKNPQITLNYIMELFDINYSTAQKIIYETGNFLKFNESTKTIYIRGEMISKFIENFSLTWKKWKPLQETYKAEINIKKEREIKDNITKKLTNKYSKQLKGTNAIGTCLLVIGIGDTLFRLLGIILYLLGSNPVWLTPELLFLSFVPGIINIVLGVLMLNLKNIVVSRKLKSYKSSLQDQ